MKELRKEIPRFLVAGFSAVGTDMGIYYLLVRHLPYSTSKAFSFLSGTCVAYVINKYWTFEKKEKSLAQVIKFFALYTVTLGANVGVNEVVLVSAPGSMLIAFLAATGTSTILNFTGQKWWVFKS